MFVFLILLLLIEKLPITLPIKLNKYRIIMNSSLTGIHTPSGSYQTEVTVPNDETNNVSCFKRTVSIIADCMALAAVGAITGAFIGFCGGFVGESKASTILDMPFIVNGSEREQEIYNRSVELIHHNKDLIMQTIVISNAVAGGVGCLLYKLARKI
jgi:hypothetical protein